MIDSFYRRLGWPATERLVVRAEQGVRADVYPRGYVVLGLVKPVLPVLPGVKSARTSLRKRSPPRTWQTLGPERNRVSGKVWPGSAVWRLGRRLRREGARRHGFVKRRAGCRRCRCTEGRGRGVTVRVAVRRRPIWRLLRALPGAHLSDPGAQVVERARVWSRAVRKVKRRPGTRWNGALTKSERRPPAAVRGSWALRSRFAWLARSGGALVAFAQPSAPGCALHDGCALAGSREGPRMPRGMRTSAAASSILP